MTAGGWIQDERGVGCERLTDRQQKTTTAPKFKSLLSTGPLLVCTRILARLCIVPLQLHGPPVSPSLDRHNKHCATCVMCIYEKLKVAHSGTSFI